MCLMIIIICITIKLIGPIKRQRPIGGAVVYIVPDCTVQQVNYEPSPVRFGGDRRDVDQDQEDQYQAIENKFGRPSLTSSIQDG